jgi:succinyl-CoA synthetase alpha subunit
MAILIDEKMRVVIQGITGREGTVRAKLMKEYGTHVVAGVTPGRKGEIVHGLPVYEGVKLLVIVPDRVPLFDVLEITRTAEKKGARFVGPNTLGLISPGKAVLGMIGGRVESARDWFKSGVVGVTSRSGGITSAISYYLGRAGVGQSTIIHVGGDAVVGTPHPEVLQLFEKDEGTEAVVMFGEIGTSQEEMVADLMERGEFTKPLIAFISGAAAKSGTRFSHAGAIIEGGRGTHEGKVKRLREAGAHVVEDFNEIPMVTMDVLKKL